MSAPQQLSAYAVTREFLPGEYVFHEGDAGDHLYIISSGQLAIIKGARSESPLVLSYRHRGEMIGEISLLHDSPRTASVMAVEPTTLYIIERNQFWDLLDNNQEFRRVVMQTLIDRLLTADESRLRAANAERKLMENFSSLSTEHARMAEVMQLRSETMRFIVHDLRNPLNLVIFALSMIESITKDIAQANIHDVLALATGAVQRMLTLIDALLEVERLETGGITLDSTMADLGALAQSTVDRLQPMAATFRVHLHMKPSAAPLPVVSFDIDRIERVITNLVDNALKFAPPEGSVTVSTWADGDGVYLAVDDDGPGIPEDQRHRIFDRFTQVTGRDETSRGFGLGLAFCRSAIQAHAGRIWVENGPGDVGTRFVFALPLPAPADPGNA